MKITIELNKKTTNEATQTAIVNGLNENFKVIEDTSERFEHLRFIAIDCEDTNIDLNGISIEVRSVSRPHVYYSIYKKYVYAVNVEF